ncbi:hypothetical protein J7E99_35355 [Streptomyces sp. ISL-44]|uniref:DUF6422 family protein n=1 Tax=Streptomyces sp. ISL-44 TaxID=2819184 RepID=UPI001BEBEFC8|nr:DUF6422 family protein [Streptomyces sp. ISL-44]MBT2545810.1 hypothetical protein [Streptomyces sp. ISL-44]
MAISPSLDKLTDDQTEALDDASLLVISARRDAAAVLRRAGLEWDDDDDFFGSRCRKCPCREFDGNGRVCGRSSCRHSASQHAS